MCREVIAERFPDHDVLAEELGAGSSSRPPARWRWVFDPLDGTTNYAHGLPIFCSSLGLEIDGRAEVGAIYDPTRQELFTAERGHGAYVNGRPLAVSATSRLIDALLVTGFPYDVHQTDGRSGCALRRVPRQRARGTSARLRGARPVLRRRGPIRRLLGTASEAVGCGRRRADRHGSRRPHHRDGWIGIRSGRRAPHRIERAGSRRDADRHPGVSRRPCSKADSRLKSSGSIADIRWHRPCTDPAARRPVTARRGSGGHRCTRD